MTRPGVEIDLSTPVSWRDVPDLALAAFRWWAGEMRVLLPFLSKSRFFQAEARRSLFVQDLADLQGFEGDRDGPPSGRKLSRERVDVWLHAGLVLRRTVELPDLPLRQLRSAIALQIDELTPFSLSEAVFDIVVVRRDPSAQKCTVDMAVLPLKTWDAVVSASGVGADRIGDVGITSLDSAAPQFRFPVPRVAGAQSAPWVWLTIWSGALALGLFGVVWAWTIAGEMERTDLKNRIQTLGPHADAARRVGHVLRAVQAPLRVWSTEPQSQSPLAVLSALSQVTPDTVTFTKLDIESGQVRISGLARNSSSFLELLEKSEAFEAATFSSPVSTNAPDPRERFSVSMSLSKVGP